MADTIIEVSTEYDPEFKARGVCVVYRNGVEISAHETFERAMHAAFPGYDLWDPRRSCEAQTDNWG